LKINNLNIEKRPFLDSATKDNQGIKTRSCGVPPQSSRSRFNCRRQYINKCYSHQRGL